MEQIIGEMPYFNNQWIIKNKNTKRDERKTIGAMNTSFFMNLLNKTIKTRTAKIDPII